MELLDPPPLPVALSGHAMALPPRESPYSARGTAGVVTALVTIVVAPSLSVAGMRGMPIMPEAGGILPKPKENGGTLKKKPLLTAALVYIP